MPTKFGLHAFHIPLYMHEFFEPILLFDPIVYGLKGNLGRFGGKGKRDKISATGEAMPTKISVRACYINVYLYKFFEPIPIN